MTDKIFPATKPATTTAPASGKSNQYTPISRIPYRQPHHRHRRSNRSFCCCCCFWILLIILILALLVTITGAALYAIYRPHRLSFSISSLHIHRLNLTTADESGSSSSHISTLINMTVSIKNPNSHISFFYDPFAVSALSNDVQLGNGSVLAFTMSKRNEKTFKEVMVSGYKDLSLDSAKLLTSDLKKKNGVPLKIQLDTRVKVKLGGLQKTKKIPIRVKCEGIKGVVPTAKPYAAATLTGSKCKVDLKIKIWKLTL